MKGADISGVVESALATVGHDNGWLAHLMSLLEMSDMRDLCRLAAESQ